MTVPTEPGRTLDPAMLTELNDLLQLDRDACVAYTAAMQGLANVGRRETVMRFRADHERHVADLTRLITRYGGTPAETPHASGAVKLATQKLGALGSDREVMLAFRANEAQSCEKYTRAVTHAGTWPADVRDMIVTAADDEARHYEWAADQLDTLGVGPDSAAGRVAQVVEKAHGALAEGLEAAETQGRRGLDAARRGISAARARLPESLPERPSSRALTIALVAAGIGFVVATALAGRSRRRR
jgi:bacterioferritin (cytochrome b1)